MQMKQGVWQPVEAEEGSSGFSTTDVSGDRGGAGCKGLSILHVPYIELHDKINGGLDVKTFAEDLRLMVQASSSSMPLSSSARKKQRGGFLRVERG